MCADRFTQHMADCRTASFEEDFLRKFEVALFEWKTLVFFYQFIAGVCVDLKSSFHNVILTHNF